LRNTADRKIRAVIFDLDNTLIQSKKGARRALRVVAGIFEKRLRKEGIRYSEANLFQKLRLIDLEMHGRKFLYNRDIWWETLLKQLGLSRLEGPWIHETTLRYWKTYAEESPLFYDTISTIHRLKNAGFRLGMVSDSDGTLGMKMKRIRQQPFLKSLEEIVVAGEDTPNVKPSRRPFTLVAERLGLQPRNCVYIGDNPSTDIEGAKGVGMMMILVKRRGLKGGHPDYLARSLSDAAKLLMRN
jgi:putative hydrolase of the HAD superfamily